MLDDLSDAPSSATVGLDGATGGDCPGEMYVSSRVAIMAGALIHLPTEAVPSDVVLATRFLLYAQGSIFPSHHQ